MGLIKIFSGEEVLALGLKNKLEEANVDVVLRDNNQVNVMPSLSNKTSAELFIQESDFNKAHPVIEAFRMSL